MGVLIERAKKIAKHYGLPVGVWQETLGLRNSHFYNLNTISKKVADLIEEKYPDVNINWLMTGKGEMLISQSEKTDIKGYVVPLVPVVAQGGAPDNLEVQVREYECEKIISPIKNISLAITVNGDSMSPEYPSGSKVFLQKINEKSFIEWGNTYVLDTNNGIIIKNVFMNKDDENSIVCRSINPNYADFTVRKQDIRGWYRVRLCMILK